jgi:hypothetical protein
VQLVEDIRSSGEDQLVLGLLRPGWEESYFERPPVFEIAGLGRMLQSSPAEGGRWNILVQGLRRVRLLREPRSDRLYRTVEVAEVDEIPAAEDRETIRLRQALRSGLIEIADGSLLLPGQTPIAYMTDVLLVALPLDVGHKQILFSILDVKERARRVLEALRDLHDRRRSLHSAHRHSDQGPWN